MSRQYCDWHEREHESKAWQTFWIEGDGLNVCYRSWGDAEEEEERSKEAEG